MHAEVENYWRYSRLILRSAIKNSDFKSQRTLRGVGGGSCEAPPYPDICFYYFYASLDVGISLLFRWYLSIGSQ
jgi:hypothetical protein